MINEFGEEKSDAIVCEYIDLSDLKTVIEFAKRMYNVTDYLDGIILNAGIMHTPYTLSKDGVELQFQVNHLGHFCLIDKLLYLLFSKLPKGYY